MSHDNAPKATQVARIVESAIYVWAMPPLGIALVAIGAAAFTAGTTWNTVLIAVGANLLSVSLVYLFTTRANPINRMEELAQALASSISDLQRLIAKDIEVVVLSDFVGVQHQIEEGIRKGNEVLIVGADLHRTFEHNSDAISDNADNVRVILQDPDGKSFLHLAARSSSTPATLKFRLEEGITQWKSRVGEANVKLLDYPLAFGGIFIDMEDRDHAKVYVWHYPYGNDAHGNRPKMALTPYASVLFDTYVKQVKALKRQVGY